VASGSDLVSKIHALALAVRVEASALRFWPHRSNLGYSTRTQNGAVYLNPGRQHDDPGDESLKLLGRCEPVCLAVNVLDKPQVVEHWRHAHVIQDQHDLVDQQYDDCQVQKVPEVHDKLPLRFRHDQL